MPFEISPEFALETTQIVSRDFYARKLQFCRRTPQNYPFILPAGRDEHRLGSTARERNTRDCLVAT
jgi:hypothetical protein